MDLRDAEEWFRARPNHPLMTALFLSKEQLAELSPLARQAVQNVRCEIEAQRIERSKKRVRPNAIHKTWPGYEPAPRLGPGFRTKRRRA